MSIVGDSGLDKRDKRGSAHNGKVSSEQVWRGFINVNLSAGQKEQFEDWLATGEVWEVMAEVVGCGAHISVKADGATGGFMCSITQRSPSSVNVGLCVTARSKEAAKSLFRALYMVHVLGVDTDWTVGQSLADPDRW